MNQFNYEHATNFEGNLLNWFVCVQCNKTINHILGNGIDLKSLHIDTTSDWKKIQMKDINYTSLRK